MGFKREKNNQPNFKSGFGMGSLPNSHNTANVPSKMALNLINKTIHAAPSYPHNSEGHSGQADFWNSEYEAPT